MIQELQTFSPGKLYINLWYTIRSTFYVHRNPTNLISYCFYIWFKLQNMHIPVYCHLSQYLAMWYSCLIVDIVRWKFALPESCPCTDLYLFKHCCVDLGSTFKILIIYVILHFNIALKMYIYMLPGTCLLVPDVTHDKGTAMYLMYSSWQEKYNTYIPTLTTLLYIEVFRPITVNRSLIVL